ncbi:MAG TPA: hypothetical protein VGK19_24060 [Capsulimonadaceae bacterium]|jgi:antitoxin component of RelBE/YafQ-DinJ toxin-antitoxin module
MARRAEYKILNMRVTPVARQLFSQLAHNMGVSQTAAFETLVRRVAREDGISVAPIVDALDDDRSASRNLSVLPANAKKRSIQDFDRVLKEIEADRPMGRSMSDDELTRDALYRDHA